jgi:hypothetical protein
MVWQASPTPQLSFSQIENSSGAEFPGADTVWVTTTEANPDRKIDDDDDPLVL